MALGTPVTIGSSGASQTGSTRTLTTTAAIPAGATGIIGFSIEGGPTVLSVTDDAGHTWTVDVSHTTGTNPNTDVHFASVYLPGGLASGAVITVTFSSSTTGNQHIHGCYVTGWAVIDRSAVGGNTSLATAWTTAATAAARADGCVAFGFAFASQNATNSDQSGSTPAMTELSDTNRCVMTYATGINSSAVTAAGTWNSASRNVCIAGIYKELVIGPVTETDTAGALTRRKTLAIGQAAETDTARPITRPIPAPATIASGQSGANSASQTITLTVAVPLGATVLVWGGFGVSGSRTLTSVTDSQGNTYAIDVTAGSAGAQYAVGIARSVIATALGIGDTITLNWSGAASTQIKYGYAAKVQTVLVKDQSNSNNAGTSNPHSWTSGNMTTTRASELIFGGSLTNAAVGGATPTNSNIELFDSGGSGIASAEVVYRIVSATGTFAATGTYGSGNASDFACGVSYYERKQILFGRASETDTAQAITRRAILGQASETDTAGTTSPRGVARQASETDTAGAITARKTLAIGQASDTETAGVITPVQTSGQTITVAQASETDTAGAITPSRSAVLSRATETDTAGTATPSKSATVNRATETDTARTIVRLILTRAIETDTAQTIGGHVGTPVYPDFTPSVGTLVFDPAIFDGREIEPDYFTNTSTVYDPALVGPQTISPDTFTNSSTVYEPHLIAGSFLYPGFFSATPTVFGPSLSFAQELEPDTILNPATVVFSPHLIIGQFLYPAAGPSGGSTVFSPRLIPGIFLYPERVENAVTVFSPAMAHAQPLSPETIASGSTVNEPALAQGQELHPDFWTNGVTVFDPALEHVSPPPPPPEVVLDEESADTRQAIRTAV